MGKLGRAELPGRVIVPLGILGVGLFFGGGQWDTLIHLHSGHTPFALAHIVISTGLLMLVLTAPASVLALRDAEFSGVQRRALAIIVAGGCTIPFGFGWDELWHILYGGERDMTAWTAPHLFLLFGAASAVFGLTVFTLERKTQQYPRWLAQGELWPPFFAAATFFIASFTLNDFVAPGMAHIAETRPGFSYPLAGTGLTVFLTFLMACTTRRVWLTTSAACGAWVVWVGTGLLIGTVNLEGGILHLFPPFPFFVPAAVFDLWLFLSKERQSGAFTFWTLLGAISAAGTMCYWGSVLWVQFYTKLPQSLSGDPANWGEWYGWAVAIILGTALGAALLSWWVQQRRFLGGTIRG